MTFLNNFDGINFARILCSNFNHVQKFENFGHQLQLKIALAANALSQGINQIILGSTGSVEKRRGRLADYDGTLTHLIA